LDILLQIMEPEEKRESTLFSTPRAGTIGDELKEFIAEAVAAQFQKFLTELKAPATVVKEVPPKTPPPRRHSTIFEFADVLGTPAATGSSTPKTANNINVLVPTEKIPEAEKMQKLSLAALLKFKKIWEVKCAQSPHPIKFQDLFSAKVMEQIWLKECELNTEFARSNQSQLLGLYQQKHDMLMTILARCLRPDSYHKYCEVMANCTPRIDVEPTRKLSDTGYETTLYPQIQNIFEIAQDVDAFVRQGASPIELKLLPDLAWGSEKDKKGHGAFAIAAAQLGRYQKDFTSQMDRNEIKACTTMEEFIALACAKNYELASASKEEYIRQQSLKPKPSLDSLSANADEKGNKNQHTGSSAREQPSRNRDARHGLFAVQDELEPPVDDDVEYDDKPAAKVYPDPREIDIPPEEMYFIKSSPDSRYKAKPPERVLPCYELFRGNCTAGSSCAYSHDRNVLIAYGEQLLSQLVNSPYVTTQAFADALKRKGTGSTPPQDPRHLPSGRGAGNVRLATRPTVAFAADEAADTENN
jgi:hypothetical protein